MRVKKYSGERHYYVWNAKELDYGRFDISSKFIVYGGIYSFSLISHSNHSHQREWALFIAQTSGIYKKWQITTYVKARNGKLVLLRITENTSWQKYKYEDFYRIPIWKGTEFGCRGDNYKYLINNMITFIFIFDDLIESISDIQTGNHKYDSFSSKDFSMDIEQLLYDSKYSDVELICGEEFFPVHRNVLEARSKVFMQMFEEYPHLTWHIIYDMDSITLRAFLIFLYSGRLDRLFPVNSSMDLVFELYKAAVNYRVRSLRLICSSFMSENLTLDNVFNILLLAGYYNDKNLLNAIIMFSAEQCDFLLSPGWISLADEDTELAIEVLNGILQYCYENS